MFVRIKRFVRQFFHRSRTINNEPLNRVSLIVIILIDIFILSNVFSGLDDVSRWHVSPTEAYPCYSQWQNYRNETNKNKDFEIIKLALTEQKDNLSFPQQAKKSRLGKVSEVCLSYDGIKNKVANTENKKIIQNIASKQSKISNLEQANRTIRNQYDSSLLEKIAGQPRNQSINAVGAEKAKQELDENNRNISTLNQETSNLKNQLLTKPDSSNFLAFLKDSEKFTVVETGYQKAAFWHPSIQLGLQSLFLLPLIIVALLVDKFAQSRRYGLVSLISWHLLVIFLIPLILKIFEFLQIGIIFKFIFDIVSKILGGLLFLVNYIYILLIPLIGFGIIKLAQKVVLNPKSQATNRIQKSRCVNCARKIRHNDSYCPHCGYYQYVECPNCHSMTYKHLSYCRECGYSQESNNPE
ncbi:zinc ribbon domain-containing protein [Brunnivagina elsteri]|uniref:Zinc ribbon domain-containing protein n=1 Tax=Brunnivagina elsteri CCALA 953 TaxID=987040 RepID=A0A2A2TJN1_9CYAN|nr:zinc ribbon domain-containing protein [Calothrix elsteri]PAX55204.1 hypothetical protein CK510_11380 [Calothrix elsteri CCALA 953]